MSNYDDDMEEIKMILLGEAGCGKTSIISRYALDRFDSNYFTTYSSTFLSKIFEYKVKNIILIYGIQLAKKNSVH